MRRNGGAVCGSAVPMWITWSHMGHAHVVRPRWKMTGQAGSGGKLRSSKLRWPWQQGAAATEFHTVLPAAASLVPGGWLPLLVTGGDDVGDDAVDVCGWHHGRGRRGGNRGSQHGRRRTLGGSR